MILIAISGQDWGGKGGHPFSILVKCRFWHREDTTKRALCSFAEKGRGLDPQDPLVARLYIYNLGKVLGALLLAPNVYGPTNILKS